MKIIEIHARKMNVMKIKESDLRIMKIRKVLDIHKRFETNMKIIEIQSRIIKSRKS